MGRCVGVWVCGCVCVYVWVGGWVDGRVGVWVCGCVCVCVCGCVCVGDPTWDLVTYC